MVPGDRVSNRSARRDGSGAIRLTMGAEYHHQGQQQTVDPRELLATKARGLTVALRYAGDITGEIDRRLEHNGHLKVLEVGCGYGMALLELRRRYGDRVELYGINRHPRHGTPEALTVLARDWKGWPEQELRRLPPPEFLYFDVCNPWPLAGDSFDVIFSHHTFMWIGDKIKALEEINRVLARNGIALLDLYIRKWERANRPPLSLEIRRNGHVIPFEEYAHHFPSLRIVRRAQTPFQRFRLWGGRKVQYTWRWANRWIGRDVKITARLDPYLEMRKDDDLDFRLDFVSAKPFSHYGLKRKGCCSVYRFREDQAPPPSASERR